ncbi:hypothetical protein LWI29_001888 [Acer saccharum]|uniref:RNase H type-1 domain-containing protein n=1 Tax=Acer saccharum TaxID=4024 RepID=A0AA39VN07_ACESA|nr:hypothetical protein LWI29_001888 [Acer saccharum]
MANYAEDKKIERKMCFVVWNPPPQDWVKLNVDGSKISASDSIAAGGVLRDHKKKWLGGFAINKGRGSVLEAELWGIFEGLKIAWKAGYKKMLVESDSQSAVLLLNEKTSLNHPLFSIIQACKALMNKDWSCYIVHTYRESNKAGTAWLALVTP